MTTILLALLLIGFQFHWYWVGVAVVWDLVFLFFKLNFLTAIIRRSIEEALRDVSSGPPAA